MTNRIITVNFQFSCNENVVNEIFSKYGKILFLKVLHKKLEKIVIIEYSCEKGAQNAISDCKEILGYPCQLKFFEEFKSIVNSKQEIYFFDVFSQPFVNLICEKVQESIRLLQLQKIQLIEKSLITSDNQILNYCGEKIYSIAKRYSPEEAGKVTGILLLTLDETDLLKLIDDENLLRKQIEEIFGWFKIKCEHFSKVNSIPTDSPECKSDTINTEHLLFSKLSLCIRKLEFYKYLNDDVLNEKLKLCELLYPYVKQYGGHSIDRIMKKLMEMDNAMLKYLSTNKIALQNNIIQICQPRITKEFLNKLEFMSTDVRKCIINMEFHIQNQFLELSKIDCPYYGMDAWVKNYKKYLFNILNYRSNALGRITQLSNEIFKINNDFSQIIPSQQYGIDMSYSGTGCTGVLPGQKVIGIPNILPTSMPFLAPYFILRPNLQQNLKPISCISPDSNIDPLQIMPNDMIASQNKISFDENDNQGDIVETNNQTLENSINNDTERLDKNNLVKNNASEEEIELNNKTDSDSADSVENFDHISHTNSMKSVSYSESSDKLDNDNISSSNDEYYEVSSDEHTETFSQDNAKPIRYPDDSELFLENLHPDVNEEILYGIFESYGKIVSIRLMRDLETHKPLGVAYVTFLLRSDAKTALDKVNFKKIYGIECQIKWSESNKVIRKSEIGNVFIKNLDLSLNTKDIIDIFKEFGEIISCKVKCNQIGESLGFAFVRYDSEDTAELAIRKMNGKLIRNKVIYVGKFLSKQSRADVENKSTNCFVGNLEKSIDNEKLRELFVGFGEIVSSIVQVDKNGISKGNGFVAFKSYEEALRAISAMNGEMINEQRIEVSIAQHQISKGNQNALNCNVYIKRLDSSIDDKRLFKEFSNFGYITSAKVMRDEATNSSLGYGFVCYCNPEEAQIAVTSMNGKVLEGKHIFVNICQKRMKKENSKSCNASLTPVKCTANNQEPDASLLENSDFTKEMFGELLYQKVEKYAGDLTGKIVGMFLELDNKELMILLEDQNALIEKIRMAFSEINKFLPIQTKNENL